MSLKTYVEEYLVEALNTTATPDPDTSEKPYAYIALLISILFFGSNFVPAAKYPIGDGISFQFFLCSGIWVVGIIVNLIVGTTVQSPPFFPLVMVGGVLWTTGNVLSTFVIPINGLGVSMLLWCTTNLFMGWASGRFGWFGLIPDRISNSALNYVGVAIAVLSGLITLFIRIGKKEDLENHRLIDKEDEAAVNGSVEGTAHVDEALPVVNVVSMKMRIIGYILAIVSGLFFGLNVSPTTYITQHLQNYPGATKNGLHYVFGHYTGILLTSFFYYVIYIIAKRNKPHLDVQSVLPAFLSGVMWGIAQAALIFANAILGQSIAFPLVSVGPAIIAGLWSIFYIKDICGLKNYLIFTVGTVIRAVACVLIALSDQ